MREREARSWKLAFCVRDNDDRSFRAVAVGVYLIG